MSSQYESTTNFQEFVDRSLFDRDYNEIYDLYQTVAGADEGGQFMMQQAPNGNCVVLHETTKTALVLTEKSLPYFLEWLTANLMDGLDAESFWSMKHAMEKN